MATIDDIGTPGAPLDSPSLTEWQAAVRDAIYLGSVPVGAIVAFGGTTPPTDWALCDGSAHGSNELAAIIGPNTPNLVDRFIIAAGATYPHDSSGGNVNHTHLLNDSGQAQLTMTSSASPNVWMRRVTSGPWPSSINAGFSAAPAGGGPEQTTGAGLIGRTGNPDTLPPYYALTYIIKKGAT